MKENSSGVKSSTAAATEQPAENSIHGRRAAASDNRPAREPTTRQGNSGRTAKPGQAKESTRTAEPRLRSIGSNDGYATDPERDSVTGGESYQHTGTENREGMRSGSSSGTHRHGRTKR